ncbi:MAG: beta-lactamase family protein [Verrucomicrobiales bacterium]|nr:beta-lactamase family protein [Verrucomicrobiales bacterium]
MLSRVMANPRVHRHLLTLTLLAIGTLSVPSPAAVRRSTGALAEARPETVGMSSERLARIDELLSSAVAKSSIPGVVGLVARHGKIVYYKAYGSADNAAQRTLQRDDIFRIASQSKAITATAVMILWEEGRFRLDDPISKFVPEFKNPQILKSYDASTGALATEPARGEITIRHLLTHTSGIGYGVIDGDERFRDLYKKAGVTDLFTTEAVTIGESVRKLARLPLHHHPGEKFTYSEGLDVLGYLIEVVSGQTFAEFLQSRLFGPLRMRDTAFYLPENKASRLVAVQKPENGQWVRFPVTFYDPDYPIKGAKTFYSGGAGLSSSAYDYATFLQMYLNGGTLAGQRVLSRTTVDTILANHTGDLMSGGKPGDSYYGLAFGVLTQSGQDKGGRGSRGTFDWGGYFNTQYFADPKEQVIGVLMKQTQGNVSDETGDRFRRLVMQAIND